MHAEHWTHSKITTTYLQSTQFCVPQVTWWFRSDSTQKFVFRVFLYEFLKVVTICSRFTLRFHAINIKFVSSSNSRGCDFLKLFQMFSLPSIFYSEKSNSNFQLIENVYENTSKFRIKGHFQLFFRLCFCFVFTWRRFKMLLIKMNVKINASEHRNNSIQIRTSARKWESVLYVSVRVCARFLDDHLVLTKRCKCICHISIENWDDITFWRGTFSFFLPFFFPI